MDRKAEISIIVPVYKVESYLRECLDSIKSQTFTDWECILVDDGSPDRSGAICDAYSMMDSRFIVVHRENGGVSAARNTGLGMSCGRYICFVDPDDILYGRYLGCLHDLAERYGADVAQVSYDMVYTTFTRSRKLVESVVTLDHHEVAAELLRDRLVPSYMWNKLFRREVISTPFPEGKVYEDMRVMTGWAVNIRRMVISPEVLYGYRQRVGSIVNSNSSKYRMEYLSAVMHRVESLRAVGAVDLSDANVSQCLWNGVVRTGKSMARSSSAGKDDMRRLSKLCHDIDIPSVKTMGLKTWWRAHMLRSHPVWFGRMMKIGGKMSGRHRHRRRNMFR